MFICNINVNILTTFTAITGTAQNVHPQYVGDSTMDTQNPKRMGIESNCKKLKKLGIIILILKNSWASIDNLFIYCRKSETVSSTSHHSDSESVDRTHFSDDECDEEDYDENHVDPRS